MTPRVVYWNNIPAPYMVERFNALAERDTLDFEAWFSARSEPGRSWKVNETSWSFRHRYLPSLTRGENALAIPLPLLQRRPVPDVLVSLYASPTFVLGLELARRRGARTGVWFERTFETWVRRRRWKERLKQTVFRRSDAVLTAGPDGHADVLAYGVDERRIFVVPHVVDRRRYSLPEPLRQRQREHVRAELGLAGTVFLYVGRLWWGKGLSLLVDSYARLCRNGGIEASLLLVGDGEEEQALRTRVRELGLKNVVFGGFRGDDSLPAILAASDVFVFPTLGDPFGMVVLEAMAAGLPVITTSAAGEIGERVESGVNGYIVRPGDAPALADKMIVLAGDPARRVRMGRTSADRVSDQSPASWAASFESAVDRILSLPTRGDTPS